MSARDASVTRAHSRDTFRRVWYADWLGANRYLGMCAQCRGQFMSVNVHVWIRERDGVTFCERCWRRADAEGWALEDTGKQPGSVER